MRVSIIIPVYNASRFLERAVNSTLIQPETSEVVLVEDGSDDNSLEICERMVAEDSRIRLLTHDDNVNKGAAASRNLGLLNAKSDFVAFLDADDFYLNDRFRAEREIFSSHPEADGVYGAIGIHFDTEMGKSKYLAMGYGALTTVSARVSPEELPDVLLGIGRATGSFHLDALTIRRSALEKSLIFEDIHLHEDSAFKFKLAVNTVLLPGVIDEPVAMRGAHDSNRIVDSDNTSGTRVVLYRNLVAWAEENRLSDVQKRAITNHLRLAIIKSSRSVPALLKTVAVSFSSWMFITRRIFLVEAIKHVLGHRVVRLVQKAKSGND